MMAENANDSLPEGAYAVNPPGEPVDDAANAPAVPAYESPVGATTHEEGEARMIISSPSGKGEREINASQWPRFAAAPREWVIKHANYTGAHHSDYQ